MYNNRMLKIMLRYRPSGRRQLGIPLKRLLKLQNRPVKSQLMMDDNDEHKP
jgi:hypothetical protein